MIKKETFKKYENSERRRCNDGKILQVKVKNENELENDVNHISDDKFKLRI